MKEREKMPSGEIDVSGNKFIKKLENFFYYYKWHLIIGGFFAVVLIVGLFQIIGKNEPDVVITYAEKYHMNSEETAELEKVLSDALKNDLNGDGRSNVTITQYQVCGENEVEDTGLAGGVVAENKKQFYNMLNTGASLILFVNPNVYDEMVVNGRIAKLDEIYVGGIPSMSNDGYSFRLGDLAIYKDNEKLQVLPADTRVCMAQKYVYTSAEAYNSMKIAFREIVG